jgi:hypothetical protein
MNFSGLFLLEQQFSVVLPRGTKKTIGVWQGSLVNKSRYTRTKPDLCIFTSFWGKTWQCFEAQRCMRVRGFGFDVDVRVCVCVCVWEREREREREVILPAWTTWLPQLWLRMESLEILWFTRIQHRALFSLLEIPSLSKLCIILAFFLDLHTPFLLFSNLQCIYCWFAKPFSTILALKFQKTHKTLSLK